MFIYYIPLILYALLYSIKNYQHINIVIISMLIIFILGSILYKSKNLFTKKNILISIGISIFCLFFTISTFNTKPKINKLEIENISKEPVTVDAIYFDEKIIKPKYKYKQKYDNINHTSLKTEYQLYNKIDSSHKMTLFPNTKYSFNIKNVKDIEILFQSNKKVANVLVNNKLKVIPSYTYDNYKANMIYDSDFHYKYTNQKIKISPYCILMSLLSLILYFQIGITLISNHKNIIKLLLLLIIELNPIIKISILSKIIATIFVFLCLKFGKVEEKLFSPLRILFSLLISFTFIGDRLINDLLTWRLLTIYIFTTILIYLLIPYMINILEKIKIKNKLHEVKNKIWKHKVAIFIITLVICLIYQYIFFPYIPHVDGVMELSNIDMNKFSNWHPYFHTIILSFFTNILGNAQYFITFRLIIYCLLLNSILFYFYRNGLTLPKIYLISILFTIFPITGVMLVTLVKDTDFSLALIALSFYLYLLIKDNTYFRSKKRNYIFLSLSLLLTATFRHNGLYITVVIALILIVLAIFKKRYLLLTSTLLVLISIYVIESPLYKYLHVEDGPRNVEISTMLHGFTYLMVEDKKIDEETYYYLINNIFSEEDFKKSYDPYNIDLQLHYVNNGYRDLPLDKKKIIKGYFKQIFMSPIELIKDRLYGVDLVWNVGQKDKVRNYKYQLYYDEFETDYSDSELYKLHYQKTLSKIVNKTLLAITSVDILNAIFFRGGIYLAILLVFTYYYLRKKEKTIIAILPVVVNILTLMLAMAHQEYRYVWVIQLCIMLIYMMISYEPKVKKIK